MKISRGCLVGLAPAVLAAGAQAQSSIPAEQTSFAIVNARIEIGDGRVIEKGTVVVRNGLIAAVGEGATVPTSAEVLDAKGATVYPGFIDAYTTRGLKLPEAQPVQDAPADTGAFAPAFMREANRKGIRPELRAADNLNLTDEVLRPYRAAGFTTAMIIPEGGSINGLGTLVNLSGRPRRESVVVEEVAQGFGFGSRGGFGANSGYPGTLFGFIATMRQALIDAQQYRTLHASFSQGGSQRPPSDASLAALQPVLAGRVRPLFTADTRAAIDRTLGLVEEFNFRPILAGGQQAWKVVDDLKARNIPVLLSLAVGNEPAAARPQTANRNDQTPGQPPRVDQQDGSPGDDPGDDPEPQDRLEERRRLYLESLRAPAVLSNAGVPFAFTTRGTRNQTEFMQNLRRAVREGLPRAVALRALTLDAARIFGVERQLGTVETGKIANLVVMGGDFLDEKARVRMLYIDGRKIDPSRNAPPAAPRPTPTIEEQ